MPVIKLGGRLGNQLFQVAFAVAQAARSGQPLLLDDSGVDEVQRAFLEAWTGPIPQADSALVQQLKGDSGWVGKLHRKWQLVLPMSRRTWVLQQGSSYREAYLKPRGQAFFDGYWQSYRYFQGSESELRALLHYRLPLSADHQALADQMKSQSSVSLHVRRGDYLQSANFSGLVEGYYGRALDRLSQRTALERVYVFSDDPQWCRENLDFNLPCQILEGNPPPLDLFLMATCRHHIIAMSTFSWWGAWLGDRTDSLVVAPAQWFESYGSLPPLSDIYPTHWMTV